LHRLITSLSIILLRELCGPILKNGRINGDEFELIGFHDQLLFHLNLAEVAMDESIAHISVAILFLRFAWEEQLLALGELLIACEQDQASLPRSQRRSSIFTRNTVFVDSIASGLTKSGLQVR